MMHTWESWSSEFKTLYFAILIFTISLFQYLYSLLPTPYSLEANEEQCRKYGIYKATA